MRILICGSRDWGEPGVIENLLDGYHGAVRNWRTSPDECLVVIEGGAKGADQAAFAWAETAIKDGLDVDHQRYPARWDRDGKAAGPIRNQRLLDEGKPDVVWAFVNKPLDQSRGTADVVGRAKAAGVPVYVVSRP